MAEITLTAKQIQSLGLWSKVCEYKGWDYLNYDRVDDNEEITFDDTFEKVEEKVIDETLVIEGTVYTREIEYGSYYSQLGEIQTEDSYLTDQLLEYEGKKVRVTIEVING